jgi:RHS repeat-associated protein
VVTYWTSNAQRPVTATDTTTSTHINYALGPTTCPSSQPWACYAPQGALSILQNGASLTSTSYYSNRLQPCRFAVNSSGTTAPSSCGDSGHSGDKYDLQYSFDLSSMNGVCTTGFGSGTNNGDVASITNKVTSMSGRSQDFCYDALNRIMLAQTTGIYSNAPLYCWGETYSVDAVANLMAINQTTNSSYTGCSQESGFSITVNGSNHITTSGFTYDSAGNLTAKPGGLSMAYDAENRMGSVAGFTYTYDGDGSRVEKSGSTLYWYGPSVEVLTETDTGGNNPVDYVFFAGKRIARVDSSNTVDYYFADQLGSSRVIVQDGITPTLCYDADFYPYGVERTPYTSTCTQHYKFTGKERDSESGLDNFGARYNSSQYGRFMSPDPGNAGADLTNPQSWNMYSYVLNNPLNAIDPDGLGCVYLDNNGGTDPNGDGGFSVDNNSSARECSDTQGTWFDGNTNASSVVADPNSDFVSAYDSSGNKQIQCGGSDCTDSEFSAFAGSTSRIVVNGDEPPDVPLTDAAAGTLQSVYDRNGKLMNGLSCVAGIAQPFIPAPNPDDIGGMLLDTGGKGAGAAAKTAEAAADKIKQASRIGPSRAARMAKLEGTAKALDKFGKVIDGVGYVMAAGEAYNNAKTYCTSHP